MINNCTGNEWIVDAQLPVYDVLRSIGFEELYVPATYSTLAGLILEQLRHVPVTGECLEWNGIHIKILGMARARISRVKLLTPEDKPA